MRNAGRKRLLAVTVAAMLVAAACGNDDDDTAGDDGGTTTDGGGGGGSLTISGPETGVEADSFQASLDAFTEESGIEVTYSGSRDFETQIRVAAEGGDLPDLAVIPQPGLVLELGDKIVPVPQETLDAHEDEYDATLFDLVTDDSGNVLGVPNKGDVKSLVWYSPSVFEENSYEIPETFDELLALQDQMLDDGITPWCIGIESGEATGWPLTDWFEDLVLRFHGPEVYDQWVAHEIPFNDPRILEVGQLIEEIWFTDGNVLNGRQSIASTGFAQAGLPIVDGDCGMHRQANFYAANFTDAGVTEFGPDGEVDAFYFPTQSDEFGRVTLTGGTYIVAFNDKPETLAAIEYLASPEYANARIEAGGGGFLSPNQAHDTSLYASDLDRTLAEILVTADPARFDGSDAMPPEVGAGTFWSEGTDWVLGSQTLEEFLDAVEASFP
ncbi:MAG: ABC transporter substrate-binding protein [Actinomycetota bacterium]